jgi:hypothetical protein
MNTTNFQNTRLLGYVQVRVGARIFAVPVQAVSFERDQPAAGLAGGFFTEEAQGEYGIIVDGDASGTDLEEQIRKASVEAVRHISQKFLN